MDPGQRRDVRMAIVNRVRDGFDTLALMEGLEAGICPLTSDVPGIAQAGLNVLNGIDGIIKTQRVTYRTVIPDVRDPVVFSGAAHVYGFSQEEQLDEPGIISESADSEEVVTGKELAGKLVDVLRRSNGHFYDVLDTLRRNAWPAKEIPPSALYIADKVRTGLGYISDTTEDPEKLTGRAWYFASGRKTDPPVERDYTKAARDVFDVAYLSPYEENAIQRPERLLRASGEEGPASVDLKPLWVHNQNGKTNDISLRDVATEPDQAAFNRKALSWLSAIPKGNWLFQKMAVDFFFQLPEYPSPMSPAFAELKLEDPDLAKRVVRFQHWLGEQLIYPALGIPVTQPVEDVGFEQAFKASAYATKTEMVKNAFRALVFGPAIRQWMDPQADPAVLKQEFPMWEEAEVFRDDLGLGYRLENHPDEMIHAYLQYWADEIGENLMGRFGKGGGAAAIDAMIRLMKGKFILKGHYDSIDKEIRFKQRLAEYNQSAGQLEAESSAVWDMLRGVPRDRWPDPITVHAVPLEVELFGDDFPYIGLHAAATPEDGVFVSVLKSIDGVDAIPEDFGMIDGKGNWVYAPPEEELDRELLDGNPGLTAYVRHEAICALRKIIHRQMGDYEERNIGSIPVRTSSGRTYHRIRVYQRPLVRKPGLLGGEPETQTDTQSSVHGARFPVPVSARTQFVPYARQYYDALTEYEQDPDEANLETIRRLRLKLTTPSSKQLDLAEKLGMVLTEATDPETGERFLLETAVSFHFNPAPLTLDELRMLLKMARMTDAERQEFSDRYAGRFTHYTGNLPVVE